jgi:hypothetical protein
VTAKAGIIEFVMVDGAGPESRRSARIASGFWVAVEGVDAELVLRRGDISATGIFFEIDLDVGPVGTVQWLHIASLDRTKIIHVMAHVVRVVSLADVQREVRGVALEFMPESDDAAAKLCELVKHILETPQQGGKVPQISPRMQARSDNRSADVSELSVKTLVIETDWSVPVGEAVRVEIIARGVKRPIRLEGQAVSVLPAVAGGPKRFRIAVRMKEELKGPLKRFSEHEISIDPAELERAKAKIAAQNAAQAASPIDQLLSAIIQPPNEPPERKHLSGELSRIPFTTLCSLLELERLSGELTIRRDNDVVRLFVKDGRFVDVESTRKIAPKDEVRRLLKVREGTFAFLVAPMSREDRVQTSMTNLLLTAATEEDEELESSRR